MLIGEKVRLTGSCQPTQKEDKSKKSLAQNGDRFEFSAIISVFNEVNTQGFAIKPEAFQNESADLSKRKMLLNIQHEKDNVVGRATDLKISEENLTVDAYILTSTQAGREAVAMMKDGLMNEFSIELFIYDAEFYDGVAYVTNADLTDFALVFNGADKNTEIVEMSSDDKDEVIRDMQYRMEALEHKVAQNITEEEEPSETEEADETIEESETTEETEKEVEEEENQEKTETEDSEEEASTAPESDSGAENLSSDAHCDKIKETTATDMNVTKLVNKATGDALFIESIN